MAISMQSLRKVTADQPPRLLIYGPEKMGKTTLASQFPNPVFIQTERGESTGLELTSFGHLTSFQEVLDAFGVLAAEDHEFKTVVIDSVSALEKLIWGQVCENSNVRSIELAAGGYGKGYVEAINLWGEVLDALNYLRINRGMTIVLLGHSLVTSFDDPETQSYSIYDIDLFNGKKSSSRALITREVDAILLIKKDVTIKTENANPKNPGRARADGGDTRWIYTQGRPAFTAGNRYSMPDRLMFPDPAKSPGAGYAAIAPFLPAQAAPEPAKVPAKKAA